MSLSKQQIVGIVEDAMVTYDGTVGTLPLEYKFVPIGVNFVLNDNEAVASALQLKWRQWMKDEGWQMGQIHSKKAKIHPSMESFDLVSADEQRRWILFRNMVRALAWL